MVVRPATCSLYRYTPLSRVLTSTGMVLRPVRPSTTALRISIEGRARPLLGYSADTAFDPELIEWLAEAELIIHETNFGVHTPLAALVGLPAEQRARMRLIHYPDQLDPATAPIRCACEGDCVEP